MRTILLSIFLVIVITGSWAFISLGFFKPVSIKISEYSEMKMIYKDHVGPYHEILPTIEAVEKWALDNKVDCRLSFGEYIDNPEIVEHSRLKSRGGCIVPSNFEVKNLPEGFKSQFFPKQEYVIAEFLGSPAIGPFKVYNKVQDFFAQQKLQQKSTVIEVYDRFEKDKLKTIYLFQKQ